MNKRQKEQCRLLETVAGETLLEALHDPKTLEVMLNPDGRLFVEKVGGGIMSLGTVEPEAAMQILKVVAGFHGRELVVERPILECTWPLDGSRFAGQIPPIVNRPAFAIRKKAHVVFSLEDYVEHEIMTEDQKSCIKDMVRDRYNILVVGGTGSGKTTLINAIVKEIVDQSPSHRIITIEDTAELQVSAENYLSFFTTSHVSMTDLLKASLRSRPDRILVGETRGPEALDLLMAWNTGHPGGAATLHADDAKSGLYKLVEYISMNPKAPRLIEPLIGRAVNGIVSIARTKTGRKVKEIIVVKDYDLASGQYIFERVS